jgi:glutathione S-transferase
MRLHDYAASGNCFKVRLLLRLARIDCELVPTDIFGGDTLTDAYARLNPFRETPVLELDDCAIVQSGAILTYLAEGTPWLPEDRVQRAQVAAWLLIEQERISPGIAGVRFRLITGRWSPDDPQVLARQATARESLDVLAGRLGAFDWLVGDGPTIADLSWFAYLSRADEAGIDSGDWPPVAAWLDRVRALEGFEDDFAPYPPNAHEQVGASIYG